MRLIKDRILKEVSSSEISTVSFEPRKKLIAIGAFEEPILIYKYPYMKLFKKIIHREKIPVTEEELLLNPDDKNLVEIDGEFFRKGSIVSPIKALFTKSGLQLLIGYDDGDLLIYNTQTWKKLTELTFNERISSLQFAQNGDILFVFLANWSFHFVDTKTWKIKQSFQLKTTSDGRAIISNDLSTLYTIADKKRVSVVDVQTLKEKHILKAHNSGINMIRLSPDGKKIVSCGNDCKLSIFNIDTGELDSYLIGHSDEVHSFVFSKDGTFIVSSSEDNTIRLWDAKTYKCVKIMQDIPNSFSIERYRELIVMGNVEGGLRTFKFY